MGYSSPAGALSWEPDKTRTLLVKTSQILKDKFATVQLTLLSIIVALVLENLLNELSQSEILWGATLASAVLWLQVLVILATVMCIWSGFAIALSLGRSPYWGDFIAPMGLLIALFAAATNLYPQPAHWWFVAVAFGSGLSGWILHYDSLSAEKAGHPGPQTAMKIQLGLAIYYLLGAVVLLFFNQPIIIASLIFAALVVEASVARGILIAWTSDY